MWSQSFFHLVPVFPEAPPAPDVDAECQADHEAAFPLAQVLHTTINTYCEAHPDTTYSHILHALQGLQRLIEQECEEADADA